MGPDLAPAARVTGAVISAITDEQLAGPTPSPGCTVGDLVVHVEGLAVGLVATARKTARAPAVEPPPDGAAGPAHGWRERIPARLAELAEAWRAPTAWEGSTQAGGVPLDAAAAGMFALDEIVVHGWELAVATGQPYPADGASVRACAEFLAGVPRSAELFGPVVAVPPDAPDIDRLVGLSGRDPAWRPRA
ncbi:TIGR03086 family metal-binding protein [Pseudonocardia humida]|uniref:TIGR03086 family protein n=1 Tax=Pseudonocardia humida TaxID=2800819 RepID=A0ABT0ZXD3_9PSEU|nr:TIGR03086 family metal-binding protein [Pseudonocardia humida]MCO1655403.1 TIGR03086 family protein [Pseudonocardia humida]